MNVAALILLLDFLFASFLGVMVIKLILTVAYGRRWFDQPDARRVHTAPVPRLGGVSFLPVMMITIAVTIGMMYYRGLTSLFEQDYYVLIQLSVLLGAGMLMYIVGIADDLVSVGFRMKFLFQFVASCIVVLSGLWIKDYYGLFGIHQVPGIVGMPVSVLLIIYIINSFNLIDGIDGLASGLGIISLVTLSVISFAEDRFLHLMIGATALGVILVFWAFNVFGTREKCTKIFMGDCGSLTLGLILSFLIINISDQGLVNPVRGARYLVIGFSTLLIPMLDVPRIVIWRVLKHRSPFLPDNNHIHHLLLRSGLSQRGALVLLLGLDVAFILLNVWISGWMPVTAVFCLDVFLWYLFTWYVVMRLRRKAG